MKNKLYKRLPIHHYWFNEGEFIEKVSGRKNSEVIYLEQINLITKKKLGAVIRGYHLSHPFKKATKLDWDSFLLEVPK